MFNRIIRSKGILFLIPLMMLAVAVGTVEVGRAYAQQANLMKIQLTDGTCPSGSGSMVGNPSGDGNWSAWATDSDSWDPDCIRAWLDDTIAKQLDVRICIQAKDDGGVGGWGGGTGAAKCTAYASDDSSDWSDWASDDADFWAIDYVRFKIDSRSMSGKYISNMRVGFQVATDGGVNVCGSDAGTARYTPYMADGGGYSSWARDNINSGNIGCTRVYLGTTILPMPPVTTLSISTDGGATYTAPSTINVSSGSTIYLKWSSTSTGVSCSKTTGSTDFVVSGASGTDTTVTKPTTGNSTTFTVTCSNSGGSSSDSIVVTTSNAPTVNLFITQTDATEYDNNFSLPADQSITQVRWSAPDATSCSKLSGPADFVVSGVTGSDTTVTSPTSGNTTTFSISCTNVGGTTSSSIDVYKLGNNCTQDGVTVTDGDSRNFYTTPPAGVSCNSGGTYYTSRTCHNGVLDGDTNYQYAQCQENACTIGTDSYASSDVPYTFYKNNLVPYGTLCTDNGNSTSRTCTNGVMSGDSSYVYGSCSADTAAQSSITLTANGQANTTSVRKGGAVSLVWDGGNSTSCSISGSGGFTNSSGTSLPSTLISGNSSVIINAKSIFTLTCTRAPTTKTQTVTVNIVPSVQEI